MTASAGEVYRGDSGAHDTGEVCDIDDIRAWLPDTFIKESVPIFENGIKNDDCEDMADKADDGKKVHHDGGQPFDTKMTLHRLFHGIRY